MRLQVGWSTQARSRVLLTSVGLIVAFALDVPLMNWAARRPSNFERLDAVQFFRSGGYLPLWLGVAAAVLLEDRRRAGSWSRGGSTRGAMIAASVIVAGIVAELGKIVFRRERASLSQAWYQFRPIWDEPLRSAGLSMPSSHALIAFAAAFAVGHYFRAARPVLILYAIGTAAIRVGAGAHYLSDVYVSMLLAYLIVARLLQAFAAAHALGLSGPDADAGERLARSPWRGGPLAR